jgi:hypothetical protein
MIRKKPVKKQAVKKKAVKKYSKRMSGTHTDKKSHNVKINVLSGTNINVNDYRIDKYIELQNRLLKLKKDKILIQQNLKKLKGPAKKFKKFDLDTTNNDIFLTTSKIKNFKKLYKSL